MTEMTRLEAELKRDFNATTGEFFSSLDSTLQYLNVKRQAYHGGTFVGNYIHKLLKVKK